MSLAAGAAAVDLAQRQRDRLPLAMQRAQEKLACLAPSGEATPLLKASQKAKTVAQRVIWLQRAASAWARPMEALSACRAGCSHCCQIPVTISLIEARLLGRASGKGAERAKTQPARRRSRAGRKPVRDGTAVANGSADALPVSSCRPLHRLRGSPGGMPHLAQPG